MYSLNGIGNFSAGEGIVNKPAHFIGSIGAYRKSNNTDLVFSIVLVNSEDETALGLCCLKNY